MVARLAELPAAELRAGVRVERVTPRSAGAIVALSGGEQARAALVIAADGRDSPLRRSLGIGARRWGYGQKALVFTVAHERPHEGVSTEIHRSGGPFTLVPLPDRDGEPQSAVVWMERGSRAAALGGAAGRGVRRGGDDAELRPARASQAGRAAGGLADRHPGRRRGSTGRAPRWSPRRRTWCRRSARRA